LKSKINFAVPNKKNFFNKGNSKSNSFLPRINEVVKAKATIYNQKPLKLSVDGKKKLGREMYIKIGDFLT
jgi:hypothetical protein